MVVDEGKERQVGSMVNADHLSGAVEVTIRARFGPRTRARPPLPVLAAVLPRRNILAQGLLYSRAEVPNYALRYLRYTVEWLGTCPPPISHYTAPHNVQTTEWRQSVGSAVPIGISRWPIT